MDRGADVQPRRRPHLVETRAPAGRIYGPIRAKPLVLPKGLIVSGIVGGELCNPWAAWVERSTDFGKTWSRFGPIVPPEGGIIQPSVVQVEGNHLRFYARSDQMQRICVSDSFDNGITWTPARPIELPIPIPASTSCTSRTAATWQSTTTPERPHPANLATSTDGEHWTPWLTLESEPGEYSYPSMIQSSDGMIHITYTWRRQKIKHVQISPSQPVR